MEKCERCKKRFDTPLKLYIHLVEKHEVTDDEARRISWPKGALL